MTKVYFLNLESRAIFKSNVRFESGFKAPSDVKKILMGMTNVVYKPIVRHTANRFLGSVEIVIQICLFNLLTPKDSIVFLQYPMVNIRVFKRLIKCLRKFKTVAIIHDLQTYRYPEDYSYRKDEIDILNCMSCIIVHTDAMKHELMKQGVRTDMVVLEVFDYLLSTSNIAQTKDNVIVFAGGLNKSVFLKQIEKIELSPYKLYAYGATKPNYDMGKEMEYKGSFLPDDVSKVEGEWGLVWDGDSVDSCTGNFGEYLKLIAPHKLSLYIACGLKIIVWDKSAMADFVVQNKIGVAIGSLSQISSRLSDLSDEDKSSMSKNMSNLSIKVREGKMLQNALQNALGLMR